MIAAALGPLMLLVQSTESVPRTHKDPYIKAVDACRKALELFDSDPAGALQLLDAALEDPRVRKRECRLRIELTPGTYSSAYDFFPYQHRGRVKLKLAERGDLASRRRHLQGAVEDFEQSVRHGLESSRPLLADAKGRLEALRADGPSGEDREASLRRDTQAAIAGGRFAQAARRIRQETWLDASARNDLLDEIHRASRAAADRAAEAFLFSLGRIKSVREISELSQEDFDRTFALPAGETLSEATPRHDWCRTVRSTLQEIGDGEDRLDALLASASVAASWDPEAPSRWLEAAEALAFSIVREGAERRAAEARSADRADREALRAEAGSLVRRWEAYELARSEAAPELARRIPSRDSGALLDRFPRDAQEAQGLDARLEACFESESPARALEALEREISGLDSSWEAWTVETRCTIATYRVIVAALRGLVAGRTPEEIASGLGETGTKLRQTGPGPEAERFGRKVEKVFSLLR